MGGRVQERTFLMTDIEGSTRMWDAAPGAMREAMSRHDSLLHRVVPAHGGRVVKPRGEGDSSFSVFTVASDAVRAAAALQVAFRMEQWPPLTPIRVRMAVHTGIAEIQGDDFMAAS